MRVGHVTLFAYRNYEKLDMPITTDLCVFVGQNAQGKTNLLESLYVVATGKSFRTSNDDELICWGHQQALIRCLVEREVGESQVDIRLNQKKQKHIAVNGEKIRRRADLFGYLNVVMFSPDDLQLVKGGPAERRRFLDLELAQVSPTYRHDVTTYHRILKQRNYLLKAIAEKKATSEALPMWNKQLVESGSRVIQKRAQAVASLSKFGYQVHKEITQGREELSIRYRPFFLSEGESGSTENYWQSLPEVQDRFSAKIERLKQAELARAQTLVGPQRDDLEFFISGRNARVFGSQGQQRTSVLSCKLAELEFMKDQTGEYPVLLLDDVMSELDQSRRHYFLGTVTGRIQTFITTTSLHSFSPQFLGQAQVAQIDLGAIHESL